MQQNMMFPVHLLVQKEKTQKEVADMLGISQSYISRLEKKIMNKMKKEITSKTGQKYPVFLLDFFIFITFILKLL